jgi:hypothetical protein
VIGDDSLSDGCSVDAIARYYLLLLRRVLGGASSVAELQAHEGLGTSGQLYHHLRQLVGAGWLRATARGHYAVPPERMVPLLAILSAAQR